MKPRTADELAAWNAQGIDIETCDRLGLDAERIAKYRRENQEEHKRNGYLYAAWHNTKAPEERIQDMRCPDGRLVYPEMAGLMKNSRDYNRHD